MPSIRVYVDEREKGSGVPEALAEMGVAVIYQRLDVGDYLVSDEIVFERKTVDDLVRSVFDGRLFDQARRLAETYPKPVIIVEGRFDKLWEKTGKAIQVRQALLAVALDYGVRIIYTRDPGDTARVIYYVARREQVERKKTVVIHRKPRLSTLREKQLYVLQSLPGVGPRLAEKLLEYFGSVEDVCKASVVELSRILGEARAREVYRVIHAKLGKRNDGKLF
ncbi:ERCC4 domain protein [Pyrolobus fumarii 1A]|uniref:ERCC4 domain protein n=1 Tax=Pyrolobus fumarii (strain DSM 11204 / 1A) TaxID=694429 RepID=G0ECS8_PYRF1|nr:ERCC4 domain-containing protein [Pyrolobus fumarii]AEM39648.1 ERCC4 domain protein [Pyrolobus fumarii 1A]